MKTLRLMMSALSLLAVAACGATDVSDEVPAEDPYGFEPEPTPEPEPTEVPNIRPDAPALTLSSTAVKPLDEVQIELALYDADGDAMTTICAAYLTSETPEFEFSNALQKISETTWTLSVPVTETEIGLAVVRCQALDARGGVSDLTESMTIEIDNYVALPPTDNNKWDICRFAKGGCKMEFYGDALSLSARVPDPQTYIPDQVRGIFVDLPHTDFVVRTNVDVNTAVARYSILDSNVPSIQVTVGTDALGSGYSLEILPYAISGTKFTTMNLGWRWQVRSLATDGMTKDNLFAGNVLASGSLGSNAPQHVEARVQDGLLQFVINGNVVTPAIASTNAAGSQVGFSARAAEVQFAGAHAILKP